MVVSMEDLKPVSVFIIDDPDNNTRNVLPCDTEVVVISDDDEDAGYGRVQPELQAVFKRTDKKFKNDTNRRHFSTGTGPCTKDQTITEFYRAFDGPLPLPAPDTRISNDGGLSKCVGNLHADVSWNGKHALSPTVHDDSCASLTQIAPTTSTYDKKRKAFAVRDFPNGCRRMSEIRHESLVRFRDGGFTEEGFEGEVQRVLSPAGKTTRKSTAMIASNQNLKATCNHLEIILSNLNHETQGFVESLIHTNNISGVQTSVRMLVRRTLKDFEAFRKEIARMRTHRRPDLEAAKIMKTNDMCLNHEDRIIGNVPGIEVGDQFTYRIELLIIGLHRQIQAGIASGRGENGQPIATSIVASGGYEDDSDSGETFTYSGQGGNNYRGDRRQAKDQELVRGNMALKNSCEGHYPVRVIRGSADPASPSGKLYRYDGLYDVVQCFFQPGASGFNVWQFKLARRSGQPPLGSFIVRFVGTLKKKGLARPHVILEDLSGGQERLPVCVVNEVDRDEAPTYFVYVSKMQYLLWYEPKIPQGCDCVDGCVDDKKCLCAVKNGGELPYNECGHLIWGHKKVVYECGSSCRCPSSCNNRVSQRGLRYPLEVFKTKDRGWGVRSLQSIYSGGFVCEYIGELMSDAQAEQRIGDDEYLFDLDKCYPRSEWVGFNANALIAEDGGFVIDAKRVGNVARFINHSCSPNLYPQNVVYDSDDLRFPHIVLFAMENVSPLRELTYDYNYSLGEVHDETGNVKIKACYCGAEDCRGRLY